MLIKVLYVIFIFLTVRLVVNYLKKYNDLKEQVNNQKTTKKRDDDIIDAEFTVVNDKNDSK